MSQPASAVPRCVATRAKNATQHPGYILTRGEGPTKRRTKAQKAADDQHEEEENRASEMAVQEGHNRIAVFQKQMETDQAATHVDAPKPTRPCPRPRPIKKAVKVMETSNLTMAKDKAISANGKGGGARGKLAASANIDHPGSDVEEEVQVPGSRKKKEKRKVLPVKTPVRDAIEAVGLIDESTMARDDDKKSADVSTSGPQKFGFAVEHIPGWRTEVPAASVGSKPSSNAFRKRPSTMPSDFSSTAPSSKLTMGSTISSGDRFTTLFADDDLAESVERSQALARMSKPRAAQGVKIYSKVPNTSVQTNQSHRNANLTPRQLNTIQPDVSDDEMNAEAAPPVVASLVNYGSDTDMESDLEPPPSTQRKLGNMEDGLTDDDAIEDGLPEDDLLKDDVIEDDQIGDDFMADDDFIIEEDTPSSNVEFVGHSKPMVVKTKSEPGSLRVTSAVTNVGIKHKAPVANRTKSSIAHTRSLSSIASATSRAVLNSVEVEILPRSAYRIKNLPGGARAVARWSVVFIPTLIFAIGDQDEVWAWALPKLEAVLCTTVQDTWDAVYKDIPHKVTTDGPVMALATQRLSEWRNGMGTTAVTALTHFMSLQDDVETDEDHEDFANNLLFKLGFLYGSIMEDGQFKKPFQSELLVQVLVQHRCATWGAIESHRKMERALKIIGRDKTLISELEVNSKGNAVKVPHSMNKASGKISNSRKAFSNTNFGAATRGYMKSINRLDESILQDVWCCTKEITARRCVSQLMDFGATFCFIE
ncbi:uncharacterized protein EDB93DRAFT_1106744 [Suillus bovinus]|uniref:uncharacterized protein n=1 Tax=Suillus bovinus TaxID=48563 RepID=UPI001B86118A|nr:uncharacterized protein EDB93DRAFT_1106744 [Suillus bovinus]KAG2136952.1 hypothetical protein EDB93DRAFT_1106744 [Suillus bovinus]